MTPVPAKWKDTYLLLLRRSLFLGEKAARVGWDGIPHTCLRCGTPETFEHLFFHCPRAFACWVWAKQRWKASTRRSLTLSLDYAITGGDQLWTLLASATIQAVWRAWCHETFEELDRAVPAPPILFSLLSNHLKTLHILHKLPPSITRNAALAKVVGGQVIFPF